MYMEKVKLNQEQAEALEYVINRNNEKEIILAHANDPEGWLDKAAPLKSLDFDVLVKALYNGYEIEQTPEDKLLEVYKKYESAGLQEWHPISRERHHLICQGIKLAVDTLGLKIKGINI